MNFDDQSDAFRRGYAARSQVLGEAFVQHAFEQADDFTIDLQRHVTEHAWGASWARPGLEFRVRSMLNLAMLVALNRPHELETHLKGALNNGVTVAEIKEVLLQAAVYCGAPAGVDAFRIARRVLDERRAAGLPIPGESGAAAAVGAAAAPADAGAGTCADGTKA